MQSDGVPVKGNQKVHRLRRCSDFTYSDPNSKGVMPTPDTRLVALCHHNGVATANKALGKELSDGGQPLPCFTTNEYVQGTIVHSLSPYLWEHL